MWHCPTLCKQTMNHDVSKIKHLIYNCLRVVLLCRIRSRNILLISDSDHSNLALKPLEYGIMTTILWYPMIKIIERYYALKTILNFKGILYHKGTVVIKIFFLLRRDINYQINYALKTILNFQKDLWSYEHSWF